MKRAGPPPITTWILERLIPGNRNDALSGDLREEFRSGRSASWYRKQVLAAFLIGCFDEIRSRSLALVFAAVWTIWARTWCFFALWSATRCAEQIVPWPYSTILGMVISVVLSLWAALTVFGIIEYFMRHNLRGGKFWRGFWIGPVTFIILTFAVQVFSRPLGLGAVGLGGFSFFSYLPSLVVATWGVRSKPLRCRLQS